MNHRPRTETLVREDTGTNQGFLLEVCIVGESKWEYFRHLCCCLSISAVCKDK